MLTWKYSRQAYDANHLIAQDKMTTAPASTALSYDRLCRRRASKPRRRRVRTAQDEPGATSKDWGKTGGAIQRDQGRGIEHARTEIAEVHLI